MRQKPIDETDEKPNTFPIYMNIYLVHYDDFGHAFFSIPFECMCVSARVRLQNPI